MLYKKIHRQYLREWKVGRKYRFGGVVFEVTRKPYIEKQSNCINTDCWFLINLVTGRLLLKDDFEWLY